MNKKSKTKYIKISIIVLILIILVVAGIVLYKTLFGGTSNSRFSEINKYTLTNNEINSVKDKTKEVEGIKSVDVYTNSKIIKIYIKLEKDIELDKIKELSNSLLTSFTESNLGYYDVEIFVESLNESSETYPVIGYKHKTNSEFIW